MELKMNYQIDTVNEVFNIDNVNRIDRIGGFTEIYTQHSMALPELVFPDSELIIMRAVRPVVAQPWNMQGVAIRPQINQPINAEQPF